MTARVGAHTASDLNDLRAQRDALIHLVKILESAVAKENATPTVNTPSPFPLRLDDEFAEQRLAYRAEMFPPDSDGMTFVPEPRPAKAKATPPADAGTPEGPITIDSPRIDWGPGKRPAGV